MSKKMLLLVIGVFTALAFTALSGAATAKEVVIKCEVQNACPIIIVFNKETSFSIAGGDTVKCEAGSGSGEMTGLNAERESSTSQVQLLYTGCKEQNTIFHFACSNTATAGNITTNVMTVHNVALPGTTNGVGVLMTNAGTTFTCAGGFASTQVTGSLIGEFENKCNTNTGTEQKVNFTTTGDGAQSLTTYTGTTFRLEGKTSHSSGGSYANAAQSGTMTMTFNQNVILTCA
jgi:hypothetical protein